VAWGGSASIRLGGESGGKGRGVWLRPFIPVIGLPCYTGCGLRYPSSRGLLVVGPVAWWISRLGEQSSAVGDFCYCCGCPVSENEMLTKWFSSTRLETRTKESNMYASIWV
jgi:hypothetical protein